MSNQAARPQKHRLAAATVSLLLVVGCASDQAETTTTNSASIPASTTSTTSPPTTSTTVAVFDQETADSVMEERFGTTTTVSAFLPNDPTDEEKQLLILMANSTLSNTRFSTDEMESDEWGVMLRDGSVAACRELSRGASDAKALGAALDRAPGIELAQLSEDFDLDAYLLAIVFLGRGMATYCPDLWTVDSSNSDQEAERFQAIWNELTGLPATDTADDTSAEASDSENVRQALITALETGDFERVELVTFGDGEMVIEGRLRWASEDRQRPSHFAMVELIAESFNEASEGARNMLFGTDSPDLVMRTTSTSGDYAVSSITPWELLQRINDRQVSTAAWWEEAGQ